MDGSIEQLLNRWMKQTGAPWEVGRMRLFVELAALANSSDWNNRLNN